MLATRVPARRADVDAILAHARGSASRQGTPALVVLVGLPGAGKTTVARELRARTGALVIESDAIRRLLFPRRTYSQAESRRLFGAIHAAIDELLDEGRSVVLDATNLTEDERAPLYEIADNRGAKLLVVEVTAPEALARRRLAQRREADLSLSEADEAVFEKMRDRTEPIQRPHHVVDTSQDIGHALAAIAKEMAGP